MSKPEWGQKRTCQACTARFYDMKKKPATCPKCGIEFNPSAAVKKRRGRPPLAEKKKAEALAKADEKAMAKAETKTNTDEEIGIEVDESLEIEGVEDDLLENDDDDDKLDEDVGVAVLTTKDEA